MKLLRKVVLPLDSVNDEEVKIVLVPHSNGTFVSPGQTILEYETSKTVNSIELDGAGYIAHLHAVGDIVTVGATLALIFDVWDECAVEAIIAEENVANIPLPSSAMSNLTTNITAEVQMSNFAPVFSLRAETLMLQNALQFSNFSAFDFVTENDVKGWLSHAVPTSRVAFSGFERALNRTGSVERIVVICANQIAAEVVQDIIGDNKEQCIVGYVVDDAFKSQAALQYLDCNVFDFPDRIDRSTYDGVVIAMGGSLPSMRFRQRVFEHYLQHDVPFTNLISATANIASQVNIGIGNIIESNVYIGTGTTIGDNNFISYATVIGHHSQIGDGNLFAPGVMMAGRVSIGNNCILPTGINFIDNVKMGDRVVLPVGYNVTTDLPDDSIIKMRGE